MPLFESTRKRCVAQQAAMKARLIGITLVLATLLACNAIRRGANTDNTNLNGPTIVEVDNQGFLDMTIYATPSSSTQRVRLGIANGHAKTNLTIPPFMISGLATLRFIADPIGGRRATVSQEIVVTPGDTVVMTIPPA
jgi:hypothetical protein